MGSEMCIRDRSWPFAERVVQGIVNLKKRVRQNVGRLAYANYKGVFPCLGCDSGLPMGRAEHNRVAGECKFHDIDPDLIERKWTCPGCTRVNADGKIRPRPRGHKDHTNDPTNCRMPWTEEQKFSRRVRGPGIQHPREGRQRAAEDPDGNAGSHDLTESD